MKNTPVVSLRWSDGAPPVNWHASLDFLRLSVEDRLLFLQQAIEVLQTEEQRLKTLQLCASAFPRTPA